MDWVLRNIFMKVFQSFFAIEVHLKDYMHSLNLLKKIHLDEIEDI